MRKFGSVLSRFVRKLVSAIITFSLVTVVLEQLDDRKQKNQRLFYIWLSCSHYWTQVCVFAIVSRCSCVFTHVRVCVRVRESHSVWHDKRWPSVCVLHPIPVMPCRTQVSVVMVTQMIDSSSVPGRQICLKCFPLLSRLFPFLFSMRKSKYSVLFYIPSNSVQLYLTFTHPERVDWSFSFRQ